MTLHKSVQSFESSWHVLRNYDQLTKYAKKIKLITELDASLLNFAHSIRNDVYHAGENSTGKPDLALSIYFYLVKTDKRLLIESRGFTVTTGLPGYEQIDFGQGLDKDDKMWRHNTDEYANKAYDYLIKALPDLFNFSSLAFDYTTKIVNAIEMCLIHTRISSKEFNFYNALINASFGETLPFLFQFSDKDRKPKNIDSLLITAAFIRLNERNIESNEPESIITLKQFNQYRKALKGKYPHWINLENIKKRIAKLKTEPIETAIKNFINITEITKPLHADLLFSASILEGYEQQLYDEYRGK